MTTYKFTIYMMRAPLQYGPKALLISDPIWWNQQNPSARACMLHFMSLAHERFPGMSQIFRRFQLTQRMPDLLTLLCVQYSSWQPQAIYLTSHQAGSLRI